MKETCNFCEREDLYYSEDGINICRVHYLMEKISNDYILPKLFKIVSEIVDSIEKNEVRNDQN